ncbi:MAG: hypothetical protein QOI50_2099 [Pseudonocardiales bacterium]|jgi:hypothetical protein|nr:hypothetical protein [Pseudonocardia sp.]MDT7564662.1 hypothetical protein [Pseudonocardiales bacterium]MDT7586751.1 hypothetical protein [Pseudonocardiales bacterium]MDT7630169.1 hypothetical protein [Pseudonocardiales bacterium]MDT7637563.1 hypothetical protein [Pseudonocardiales bacterium]
MPQLGFACTAAVAEPYAASPSLLATLRVTESTGVRMHTVALRCQLRIEPHKRRYSANEASRLSDLFGEPSRWGETLKPMQLATIGVMVQGFTDSIDVPLSVPLSADTEVATGKYFHGLDDGDIPLLMLFSGTAFYHTEAGIQVELVPWHLEVSYRLPVTVWREIMDQHFPNSTWLSVRTETHTALQRYRAERGTLNWDDTVADLLKRVSGAPS